MNWNTKDLLFFIFCFVTIGWTGNSMYDFYKGRVCYTKEVIEVFETTACWMGVMDTVNFYLKKRKEPANCDFREK